MSPAAPEGAGAVRPTPSGWVLTLTLAALSMIGPFTIDTIFPGFAEMGEEFGSSPAALQQVTSVYLLAFALMSVVHGPLSDALGRRPVMLVGLGGYVVASAACALAPSLGWLLVGRVVQGLFAGAATIVSRAVIRDLFSGAEAQRLMSQVMVIFAIAPAIAPVVGGWILQWGRWPWIFWFVGAYGVLAVLLVVLVLPESLPPQDRQPLRLRSVVGGLLHVARSWAFERLALAAAFAMSAYFVYVVGAPIVVLDLLGLGEQDFWVLFVPQIGGFVLGSWLTGRLAGRVDEQRLVDVAMGGLLVAAAVNVVLAGVAPSLPWAVVGPTLMGVVIGIVFPLLQLKMLDLFPAHRGSAASMASFATLTFNALLAGAIIPLVSATLLTTALASAALGLAGVAMWVWHRRAVAPVP
ncbi:MULTISPECIES: multidrug effflux MFS transporter [unclassified Ornithinimicrobium]|uniref:multidrug effflux MFS transporter n=1 Tax=unclassified Ornithinimicrobium TaxID=2615080 RepID=UPI0038534272